LAAASKDTIRTSGATQKEKGSGHRPEPQGKSALDPTVRLPFGHRAWLKSRVAWRRHTLSRSMTMSWC